MTVRIRFICQGWEGNCSCALFPGAFAEVLRLAALYGWSAVWCDLADPWATI